MAGEQGEAYAPQSCLAGSHFQLKLREQEVGDLEQGLAKGQP